MMAANSVRKSFSEVRKTKTIKPSFHMIVDDRYDC